MNYYEILQVCPDASEEVIKAAYKALVKKYHPDNGGAGGTEKIQIINEAYNVLSDPKSRKSYDAQINNTRTSFKNEEKNEEFHSDNNVKEEQRDSEEDYVFEKEEPESKVGKAFCTFFRSVSKEMQRNKQVMENAYYDGQSMTDYELVRAFEKNYGFKRQGYAKVLEEREMLVRDYEGRLRPTDKFKYYWR